MPDGRTHAIVGSAAGAFYAVTRNPGQPGGHLLLEAVGGAFGGYFGAKLPDALDPPNSPGHRAVGHAVIPAGYAAYSLPDVLAGWQAGLRRRAALCAQASAQAQVPLQAVCCSLLEALWRFLAGFLVGLYAGYVSHLALDATTPGFLPLLGCQPCLAPPA